MAPRQRKLVIHTLKGNLTRVSSFNGLLNQNRIDLLHERGFKKPNPIQQFAMSPILSGEDVVLQSNDLAGVMEMIAVISCEFVEEHAGETGSAKPTVLILSPARISTEKIQEIMTEFGKKSYACIGGVKVRKDIKKLGLGVPVVTGTPGRVYDLLERRALKSDALRLLVLDDSHKLCESPEKVYGILSLLPSGIQIASVSTGLPMPLVKLIIRALHDPVLILTQRGGLLPVAMKMFRFNIPHGINKFSALRDILQNNKIIKAVIVVNNDNKVDKLKRKLREIVRNFHISVMHVDTSLDKREAIKQKFMLEKPRVLITTHSEDPVKVFMVIIYDLPQDPQDFIKCIAWPCQYGIKGIAISLVTAGDHKIVRNIENLYGRKMAVMPSGWQTIVPDGWQG